MAPEEHERERIPSSSFTTLDFPFSISAPPTTMNIVLIDDPLYSVCLNLNTLLKIDQYLKTFHISEIF